MKVTTITASYIRICWSISATNKHRREKLSCSNLLGFLSRNQTQSHLQKISAQNQMLFFFNNTSSLVQGVSSAHKPGFAWAACRTFSGQGLPNTQLLQDYQQSKQCNKKGILKTTDHWHKIQTSKKENQNKFCTAGLSHVFSIVLCDFSPAQVVSISVH